MASSDYQTLNELFLRAVEIHSKPAAFLYKSDRRYQSLSSCDALRAVAALARAFEQFGAGRGDRVAILSENRVEWALTDYAVLGLGAIVVPIYPTLLEPDIEFLLSDSGSKGIVVSTEAQLRKVLNVRSKLPELKFVAVVDGPKTPSAGVLSWWKTVEAHSDAERENIDSFSGPARAVKPEDTASILYTSGTMGRPKGVVLTHANLVSNIRASEGLFPLGDRDVAVSLLPLSHVFQRMLDYYCFWQGVSIAYPESLDTLAQNLLEVRPTMMAVVPRVLEKVHERVMERVRQARSFMRGVFYWCIDVGEHYFQFELEGRTPPLALRLKHALADRLAFSKVRAQLGGRIAVLISGAAPLSSKLAQFYFAMGLPVYEGYGLTETSPVIAVNYPGHVRLGTVGQVLPGVEVRLGEEREGDEGGEGGEILVRGPNVTPGYYHLEEENRRAFVDGWFRTGDLGALDADGYLRITGRKKNLFKTSGGKYVSPEKLENLFQGHPYISQMVILGDSRKFVGALIVPNFDRLETYARAQGVPFKDRGELVASSEINEFLRKQVDEICHLLPPHERIRQFILLPREFTIASGELSATQKIKRSVVEERYRHEIEEMFLRHAPQLEVKPAVS